MSFLVFDTRFDSGKINVGFNGQYGHDSQDGHEGHDSFCFGLRGKAHLKDLHGCRSLPTTKRIELFSAKKFAMAALGNNDKSLYGSILKAENVPVTISDKYSDYTNVFSSDSAAEPSKHIGVNDYPMGLVNNFLSHPLALRYRSSTRKTVAFDCVSEVSIT